jgi:predicted ATPase
VIIKFSNLGAIKETELDLRPLTVIIGPNNSNKTYIAYSLYGLFITAYKDIFGVSLENKIKQIDDSQFSLTYRNITNTLTKSYKEYAKQLKQRLPVFFQDSTGSLFSKTELEVAMSPIEVKILCETYFTPRKIVVNDIPVYISIDDKGFLIQVNAKEALYPQELYNKELALVAFDFWLEKNLLLQNFVLSPFLLPAERNAFILTYKMLDNRRYRIMKETRRGFFDPRVAKQHRLELLKEQGDIQYPQPVEDFLEFLTDVELQPIPSKIQIKKNNFQKLAEIIEEQIQGNNKIEMNPTKFGGKEIKILVKEGLIIDLYNSSSSIKQLVPLILYLRYRATKNALLIIDEPELGLYPEAQAKLLEILAILVNLGVKVLLTTHSPYFMAHLNNLINGDKKHPSVLKKQASALYLNDSRAFLSDEQVSAYEMRDNKLVSLKDPDYGIRWDTLSDVSVDIQQKYFQISELKEAKSNGKKK